MAQTDPRQDKLVRDTRRLIDQNFGGSFDAAFHHCDTLEVGDRAISHRELKAMLRDAKLGNRLTRNFWVKGVMRRVDTSQNGKIEKGEIDPSSSRRTTNRPVRDFSRISSKLPKCGASYRC